MKAAMRDAFKCHGPRKFKKFSFNNIAAMKISAILDCNSTNSFSADTKYGFTHVSNIGKFC